MAASFSLPTVLANLAAGNQPLSLIDGDFTATYNPLVALNTYGNYYADTGAANAYVITVSAPQTVAQTAGLPIQFLATNANTGASTLQINALAAKNIVHIDGTALIQGDIPASGLVTVIYDGTSYQLQTKGKANALEGFTSLTGVSGTNTITATAAPTFGAYATGQKFIFMAANANTGATTLDINGLGAKNVFSGGIACVGGEIDTATPVEVFYDGTQFRLLRSANASAFTFITSGTASNSATIDFTAISATYDNYLVVCKAIVPATNADQLMIRMSIDAGATYKAGATDYIYANKALTTGAAVDDITSAGDTRIVITGTTGISSTATDGGFNGTVSLFNLNATNGRKQTTVVANYLNSGPAGESVFGGSVTSLAALTTSAVNAIRLMASSGNITSGTFYLYGMKKS